MSRWQPVWLLLSFGLAAGLNHATRPRAEYALSAGERTLSTGTIWLDSGASRQELKLVTIHVVAQDVARLFAPPVPVRELWLRSPEQDGAEPDVELFVDLRAADGGAIARDARDVASIRGRELQVLPAAGGGEARSRVRLRGEDMPSFVSEGKLVIEESLDVGAGETRGWRVQGELQLMLEDDEHPRLMTGGFNARLVWE